MDITIIILIVYILAMFFIAWFFSRKRSIEAYFVNQRKTSLWLMTISTVATAIGAGATVSIVSEVYNTGISYGIALPISFISGMLILALLAKKIKEIGDQYDAYTVVDFFEKRFDRKNKILTGILQLLLIIILMGVQAIAIASLASILGGIDYKIAILFSAAIVILYTAIGGLRVDIITDFIQFWIILLVFVIAAIIGYQNIGSFNNLLEQLPHGHLDPLAFGGLSWFIGVILISGFVYIGNTVNWQRIFSAENQNIARKSFYIAIPITLFLGIVILFLGLVAAIKLPDDIQKEIAIFLLMKEILPPWLLGFGFAAILAAIMSSVDSLLIGGSSIVYKALLDKKNIDNSKKIFYARILTLVFGILGFVIAFITPNITLLLTFGVYLALIFVPPIIAGIYSKKTSSNACFYSILIPTITLVILFPILKEQVFLLTTLLGILIITLYDKIFKKRNLITTEN